MVEVPSWPDSIRSGSCFHCWPLNVTPPACDAPRATLQQQNTLTSPPPAMWLRRRTGQIEELPNTGIPLGVMEGVTYESAGPVRLQGGDIVLIGTDGIWEARNPAGEVFGKQRLREMLSSYCSRSAAEIRAAVVEDVCEFIGIAPQEDDITLVVIRKPGN